MYLKLTLFKDLKFDHITHNNNNKNEEVYLYIVCL